MHKQHASKVLYMETWKNTHLAPENLRWKYVSITILMGYCSVINSFTYVIQSLTVARALSLCLYFIKITLIYIWCREGDVYDCGIFTYRGEKWRAKVKKTKDMWEWVFRILWNDPFRNYYDYCYSHIRTREIGAQLKPKRCLCDFCELPKINLRSHEHHQHFRFGNACDTILKAKV